MSKQRREHIPVFKGKVALGGVKGEDTVSQRTVRYEVHPDQVQAWKKSLLGGAAGIFPASSMGTRAGAKMGTPP